MINKMSKGWLPARLFLAVLCAVGGLSLPAFSTAAAQSDSTAAEIMAFARGGNIWTMKPDGSAQTLVGNSYIYGNNPQLSPDGRRIAFTCGTESFDICVMDADGANFQSLTSQRMDVNPVWSPDGTRFVFTSLREGSFHLFTMDADGGNQQRLAINDPALVAEYAPAWSPDGTRIAFVGEDHESMDIYIVSADGSGATTRLTYGEGIKNNPAWSPDGASIAFDTEDSIRVVNVAGGLVTTLTSAGDENQGPVYSPDGSQIAFYRRTYLRDESGTVSGSVDGIYVMQADGSGVASLNCSGGISPDWRRVQTAPPPPPPTRTPSERVSDLITLVRGFNLPYGTSNSLTVKLRAALAALEAGDTAAACSGLNDFVNHARAQSGKKLTTAQATQIIDEANSIRTELGCS